MTKQCADCGKDLNRDNASGFCRTHFNQRSNRNPEANAKRAAGVSRFARENPDKASDQARKANATRLANPEYVRAMRERMRTIIQPASYTADAMARRDMRARGLKGKEPLIAWCPHEYRPLYRDLRRKQNLTAAEARQITLGQIAKDKAKEATLSPFERQERALRNGAALQDNVAVTRFSPAANELRQKIA